MDIRERTSLSKNYHMEKIAGFQEIIVVNSRFFPTDFRHNCGLWNRKPAAAGSDGTRLEGPKAGIRAVFPRFDSLLRGSTQVGNK